jgi:hypothetical protein
MYMVLLQIEEEIALKEPGSAIVGTRRGHTWISLYVLRREVGISIVDLVIRFRGSKRARERGSYALFASVSYLAVGTVLGRS